MIDTHNNKTKIDFLIVDDQDLMLQSIRSILKKLYRNKQIAIARCGKEALQILKENEVEFLITDWNMPNVSGIELLKLVRNNPDLHNLPVLMISDEIDRKQFLYAIEEGVDGYQIKPFTQQTLMTAVDSIISNRKNRTPFQKKISRIYRLFLLKEYDNAIAMAHKLFTDEANPDIQIIIAESYYSKRDHETALTTLNDLVLDEKIGKALHLFGRILMADGNVEKALPYLQKALTLSPINYERKIDVGKAYLKLEKNQEAARLLNSIMYESPTDISMLSAGKAYLDNGDFKRAGAFFDKVSEPIPETVSIFNDYAIHLSKSGEFEKSLKYYKKCLGVYPKNEVFLLNTAIVYYRMKNKKEACLKLKRLLNINPNNRDALELLSSIEVETE